MQRFLFAVIVLLVALLLARDARVARADAFFVNWLLRSSKPAGDHVPLLVVELGRNFSAANQPAPASEVGSRSTVSPLELALFVQSILDSKPSVIAIEPILRWRDREKDQEQVFLDQAMRVPKLLLGAELTPTPDPDAPASEIPGFANVAGRRGDLATFTGISRQPDEDLRLISTLGYVNLPEDVADETHVPLLFNYRGEVIPAFALQAFLTWARIPMSEVKIVIGSHIELPSGRNIPINPNGTLTLNPNAARLGQHFTLNELLMTVQQKGAALQNLHNELVLARVPDLIKADDTEQAQEVRAANVLAAAVATLQANRFVSRVSLAFDCGVLLVVLLLGFFGMRASRVDVILGAIAFSAAYCLLGFILISQKMLAVPAVVPFSAILLFTGIALLAPRPRHKPEPLEIAASPPAP